MVEITLPESHIISMAKTENDLFLKIFTVSLFLYITITQKYLMYMRRIKVGRKGK